MRINASSLVTVLYAPRRTFAALALGPMIAPFLPVLGIILWIGGIGYQGLQQTPEWQDAHLVSRFVALIFVFVMYVLELLLVPLVNTLIVSRLRRRLGSMGPSWFTLLSAFTLGNLPVYCSYTLMSIAGLPSVGLHRVLPPPATLDPSYFILAATLGVVTPFFLWAVGLWWVALIELVRVRPGQGLRVVGFLALVDMLAIGLVNGLFAAGLHALLIFWGAIPSG